MKSPINVALAAELRAERVAINMTVEELRTRAGITKPTMLRILAGTRDINVTQLAKLSAVLGLTPEALFRRAVDRMGGIDTLMQAPVRDEGVSEEPSNVHVLKSVDDLDTGELDASIAQAALRDNELDTDEYYS